MIWGIEVRARRLALGLSQQELAAMLDCGQSAVSGWEQGKGQPRDPVQVDSVLAAAEDAIEDAAADMMEATLDQLGVDPEDSTELAGARVQFSPPVGTGLPADLGLVACARLLVELREAGADARLVPGMPGEPWVAASWATD